MSIRRLLKSYLVLLFSTLCLSFVAQFNAIHGMNKFIKLSKMLFKPKYNLFCKDFKDIDDKDEKKAMFYKGLWEKKNMFNEFFPEGQKKLVNHTINLLHKFDLLKAMDHFYHAQLSDDIFFFNYLRAIAQGPLEAQLVLALSIQPILQKLSSEDEKIDFASSIHQAFCFNRHIENYFREIGACHIEISTTLEEYFKAEHDELLETPSADFEERALALKEFREILTLMKKIIKRQENNEELYQGKE